MEGLEVSAVAAATLSDSGTGRIDAEYFQQAHLADAQSVESRPKEFSVLSDLKIKVDGSAFYPGIEEYYDTGNLPFLRVGDVNGPINLEACLTIPAELCEQFPTLKRVKAGDILFTKGGAIDRVGYVTGDSAVSRDLIFLNTSKLLSDDRLFLFSFFETSFFKRSLVRSSSQTAQPHLTITLVRNLPIYWPSSGFRTRIAAIVAEAHGVAKEVEQKQAEAETALLSALGLAGWTPPEPLSYTARAADALTAARLDAQYFMPSKLQMIDALQAMPGQPLGARFKSVREMFDPARADPDLLVRNFDLPDALQPILDDDKELAASADIGSLKKTMRNGDVAMSRLRAYLKETAVVRTGTSHLAVGSSEFIVLRPAHPKTNMIAPETLMIFLRSAPVQTILKWCQDGSQHPRFSERDLLAIPLPDAVSNASAEIEAMVQSAFTARARSRALLASAKRAVEIAIEQGEDAALAFLIGING